jgi:hypothetical protein
MKRVLVQSICCAVGLLAAAGGSLWAQNEILPAYYGVRAWTPSASNESRASIVNTPTIPIATFNYNSSKAGGNVSISLVGRNPFLPGKAVTNINVVLIPLVITIGSTIFDSTAVETCGNGAGKGLTDVQLFNGSPLFDTLPWSINGVNVGTTQFGDAFRRAEFWSVVGGTNYHTHLNVSVGPTVTISSATVGTHGIINGSGCGTLGIVSTDWFGNYLETVAIPGLNGAGVTTSTFPIFVIRNVVQADNDPPTISGGHCCILGYHGAYTGVGGGLQTYSPTEYDTSGRFGTAVQDGSVIAHEVLEWFEDPVGDNPAPGNWGGEGQVPSGSCQNNYEVGDPLSGTMQSAGGTLGTNGVTYHVQELAFFSWFYKAHDGSASLGAGGSFSSNNTFTGPSQPCLPGGTFTTP